MYSLSDERGYPSCFPPSHIVSLKMNLFFAGTEDGFRRDCMLRNEIY